MSHQNVHVEHLPNLQKREALYMVIALFLQVMTITFKNYDYLK